MNFYEEHGLQITYLGIIIKKGQAWQIDHNHLQNLDHDIQGSIFPVQRDNSRHNNSKNPLTQASCRK